MKKKIIGIILMICLVFSLTGCRTADIVTIIYQRMETNLICTERSL